MFSLEGKKALVVGIANEALAFGCAKAFREQGAELAITFQNEKAEQFEHASTIWIANVWPEPESGKEGEGLPIKPSCTEESKPLKDVVGAAFAQNHGLI